MLKFMLIHYDNKRYEIIKLIQNIFRLDENNNPIVNENNLFNGNEFNGNQENVNEPELENFIKYVKNKNIQFVDINNNNPDITDENFDIIQFFDLNSRSPKMADFIINNYSNNRTDIMEMINENRIAQLKVFTLKNFIRLRDLNDKSFDILCYAIQNNESPQMIDFIISQEYYDLSSYTVLENSPLYIALATKKFEIGDILLKNKVDINQFKGQLIKKLQEEGQLDKMMLKYLLRNGYKYENITDDIPETLYYSNKRIFIYILKNYVFDSIFILNLLFLRSNDRFSRYEINTMICNLCDHEKQKFYGWLRFFCYSYHFNIHYYGRVDLSNIDIDTYINQLLNMCYRTGVEIYY